MGRLGVRTKEELLGVVEALEKSENLSWDGIFTHFSTADEPDPDFTLLQHSIFIDFLRFLKKQGIKLPTVHMNNTAAAIAFPEFSADMIRLGIGLYGMYPSQYIESLDAVQLEPALSLKARIAFVKEMVTKPRTVSYGATYVAKPDEVIATIPIGYADGYSRALSNRGIYAFPWRTNADCWPSHNGYDDDQFRRNESKARRGSRHIWPSKGRRNFCR